MLLHSTSATNAAILDDLLTKWEEMGYTFASLDQLPGLARPRTGPDAAPGFILPLLPAA